MELGALMGCVLACGFTAPVRVLSVVPLSPPRAETARIASVLVDMLPPPGFVWADELDEMTDAAPSPASEPAAAPALAVNSWYDLGRRLSASDDAREPAGPSLAAGTVGIVVPTGANAKTKPTQAVHSWYDELQSWYDEQNGLREEKRLLPRVESWYDRGTRLETPAAGFILEGLDIDDLIVSERIGMGTQSEVLLGELPGSVGQVAVKIGLKRNAISREAAVLAAMSGVVGFPQMLYHDPGPDASAGGFLLVELLGPSLEDLRQSKREQAEQTERGGAQGPDESERPRHAVQLSGSTLLRIGRSVLRRLEQLHLAGFVHNDVKPANILLGKGSPLEPTRLHLIDFGSCTQDDAPTNGPIGTPSFASYAAEDCQRPMSPADDVESLAYVLAFLAAGGLPWQGRPIEDVAPLKREWLTSSSAAAEVFDSVPCPTASAALHALWAEVKGYHGDGDMCVLDARVDYEACLVALGGGAAAEDADADALSQYSFLADGIDQETADALRREMYELCSV